MNCPNCGAVVKGNKCEYCGTTFRGYDGETNRTMNVLVTRSPTVVYKSRIAMSEQGIIEMGEENAADYCIKN